MGTSQDTAGCGQEPLPDDDAMDTDSSTTNSKSAALVAVGAKRSGDLYIAVLPPDASSQQPHTVESERTLQWKKIEGEGKGKLQW